MSESTSKIILIAASIIYGLAFIPSVLFAMLSPMVSDGRPPAWLMGWIVIGCAAIPLSMLIGIILAWLSYRNGFHARAVILTLLPLPICFIQFIGIAILQYRK